jgi:hypothetical protein
MLRSLTIARCSGGLMLAARYLNLRSFAAKKRRTVEATVKEKDRVCARGKESPESATPSRVSFRLDAGGWRNYQSRCLL